MVYLDVGCGNHKHKGTYIGVDKYPGEDVDIVCDIEHNRLPLEDNIVDGVYSRHFFEHVDDFNYVLKEIYRVCKDGAIVEIIVPHFTRPPYEWHKRHYRYNCFIDYEVNTDSMLGIPKLFRCLERRLEFSGYGYIRAWLFNKIPYFYEYSFLRNCFPCSQIYIKFKVIKGMI